MNQPDLRPTLAAPDDDPFLWLEEIEGEPALAFAAEQSGRTLERFGGPAFERDRDALAAILNRKDRVPLVAKRGGHVYNFWQDDKNPRGLWRRTSYESYRAGDGAWQVVLDIDALAAAEGEDWVWAGSIPLPGSHDRAMLRLSRGGSDAAVFREFDLTSGSFVPDGFVLPEAKGGVAWLDRDTLLMSSALGEGMATTSGYARTVRLWCRGTDPLAAPVIFEAPATTMTVWSGVDRIRGRDQVWFVERLSFFDGTVWLGDSSGAKIKLDLPTDAEDDIYGDWLFVKPRTPWTVAGVTHPPDRLIGIALSAFLAGERNFTVLFEPGERRVLSQTAWSDGRLILSILDNMEPRFEVHTPGEWHRRPIETLSPFGVVEAYPLESEPAETSGTLLVMQQDPLTPLSLYALDISGDGTVGAPALLRTSSAAFDASGLVVSRHEAISVDGTRIPYTQVGPAGETGEAPVHLYGYGGFGVTELPTYRGGIGKLWLERGGTSVVANLRGGGEFGIPWHEAGKREGKALAHADFAAVAADLVRRGVTRASRIAAEGGSNGGLLIANMLTRFPGHFGALFCTIPLIDMRRYSKLLAGASWIAEYGDPEKPEDWAFLQKISAYHTVEANKAYPPILIATTKRDDRVHPGHARKMAAKLVSLGYPAHYYEPAAGGHGYGKDNNERAAFIALGYRFLRESIGWEAA